MSHWSTETCIPNLEGAGPGGCLEAHIILYIGLPDICTLHPHSVPHLGDRMKVEAASKCRGDAPINYGVKFSIKNGDVPWKGGEVQAYKNLRNN